MLKINQHAKFRVYADVFFNNLRKKGFVWFFKRITLRVLKELGWALLLPFAIVLHFCGFCRIPIRTEHIGHLTTEVDTFLKAKKLGLFPHNKYYFFLAPLDKVANEYFLNCWSPQITFISNKWLCALLEVLTWRFFMRDRQLIYSLKFFGTQPLYNINKQWGNRAPLLKLSAADEQVCEAEFARLGITKKQWFVCVHVREGGFLPHNEILQSHRNACIENTFSAMKEIVARGGIVVRMGDSSMVKLPNNLPGVIDYAHHPLKSDRLDVFLCAKAKFFLGCTSGLAFVSAVFGVPVAHANMIPVETLGLRPDDISIPKLLQKKSHHGYLGFEEIFSSKIGGFFFTYQYAETGIVPIENQADEIHLLVCEMLDRLEGKFVESLEDKQLHARYMSLFMPGHYSYDAASKVCLAFLRKYQYLLEKVVD